MSILLPLLVLALPVVLAGAYLALLTLLSALPVVSPVVSRRTRFDVLVPAHDEEPGIERTVASLRALAWPADAFRVLVVADNCTDRTAAIARAAGARVLERTCRDRRGKGYALEFGFAHSRDEGWADAVVVVDADSIATPNLLAAFDARLSAGLSVVQCHYGVLNPDDSWRTRLMTIAMSCFHDVRSRARERLGLSSGVRGNGWCVTHAALARVPFRAYTLAEDVEYGIDLALGADLRVAYAAEACVRGEMVSSPQVAARQRSRWEGGRAALVRSRALPLARAAWSRRSLVCLDLLLDLLLPPLSWVALGIFATFAAGVVAGALGGPAGPWFAAGSLAGAALALHVARGWQLSGVGWRGAADLARVPGFILWKLMIVAAGSRPKAWVRTDRNGS